MSLARTSVGVRNVPVMQALGTQGPTQPAPTWALSYCPDGYTCEEIVIVSPTDGHTISNPVLVTGLASSCKGALWAAVLDGGGARIGMAPCLNMDADGQPQAFMATVTFTPPANSQPGCIQVWSTSNSNGATAHLASVSVTVRGYDLDLLLGQLEAAVAAKDYAALRTTMTEPFSITLDAGKPKSLSIAEATDALRRQYLGPGAPRLDFSVNTSAFVRHYTCTEREIIAAIYAPGWGMSKNDEAVLLITAVDGQARWSGLHLFTQ